MDPMKFAIASEHRDFFSKNGYIEFADMLTEDQLHRLNQDIQQALVKRLKLENHSYLARYTPSNLFSQGRDLWREIPGLKKLICNPEFAEIAWEFSHERPLRLAYDQLFPAQSALPELALKKNDYQTFTATPSSLLDTTSVQGLCCGLIICLKANNPPTEGIFPKVAGHGIYIAPTHPIDFSQMGYDNEYLLIAYATRKSVYVMNEKDPLGHTFRNWGYTLSDALTDKLNPIVLR